MSVQLNIVQTLLISHLDLNFPPTEVGEEHFLLLKIGQEGANTPVHMRIEGTDAFQIAVQGNPLRFYSQLTFVPAPSGTYVHVRFIPRQVGHHTTELLIDTSYGTQPVSVSGRTMGLLGRTLTPATQRQRALATSASIDQPTDEAVSSTRLWLKRLVVVVLLGGGGVLAYWWYTNRSALPASPTVATTRIARPSSAPESTQIKAARPKSASANPVTDNPSSAKSTSKKPPTPPAATRPTRVVEPVVTASEPEPERVVTTRTESTPPPVTNRRVSAVPDTRPDNLAQDEETPPAASRRSVSTPATDKRVVAGKAANPKKRVATPAQRPKPADVPISESDLERTLNKNQ